MKKFNLEEALAGAPVVTRDGREVSQLTLFDCLSVYRLYGVVGGLVMEWTKEGRHDIRYDKHQRDLFMKPKKVERWINIYTSPTDYRWSGNLYLSEEEAAEANRGGRSIKIEWEE
jgi:hypothetical protein